MAEGDISKSIIAQLEFDTNYAGASHVYHIYGSVYAVLYYQVPLQGWIKTFTVSDDGLTIALTGSSLQIDDTRFGFGRLLHVAGNVWACFYQGVDDDGFLKTFTIDNDGTLGGATLATLEWDLSGGVGCSAIHIDGNVFAVAYQGALGDGWLKTVTISADGETLALTGSSLEFDTGDCTFPTILHRDGTVYAIFYAGVDYDGWLKTVNIANDGTITDPVIASLEWRDESVILDAKYPRAIHIGGDVFAIAYLNGFSTVSVSADGATLSHIDDESGPGGSVWQAGFIPISGDVYCACYEGPGGSGYVLTKEIPADGEMPVGSIDSWAFNIPADEPDIVHVAGDTYATVGRAADSDGTIFTLAIETIIPPTSVGGINPALKELMGY